MKLYWADVRLWFRRGLWAIGIIAASGVGALLAGGNMWTGLLLGVGYYLLTRLVVLAVHFTSRRRGNDENYLLWRQLHRFVGRLPHAVWMIDPQDKVLLQAVRRRGRGVLRYRWDEAELVTTSTGRCVGTIPLDIFMVSSKGIVIRIREVILFEHGTDGRVFFHDGLAEHERPGRAAARKAIALEHRAGLYDVDATEVKGLLDQLGRAEYAEKPVHPGREGDG